MMPESIPPAPAGPVVDVIHGVEVHDPYRWLEDGDSPETRAWAEAQNARARAELASPTREHLHHRLTELWAAGTAGAPRVRGTTVFSLDRWGEHDQAVLVTRPLTDGPHPPTVVLDPAAAADDPTTAIDWYQPSWDGRLVAYGLSAGGDERSTLRVRDVGTGLDLDEVIPHTRAASVGWLSDASGFAYTRYAGGGDYDRHVFWHLLGADWHDDRVLFDELDEPTAWPEVSLSEDGRWALVHVELGWSRSDVYLYDRDRGTRHTVVVGHEARSWFSVDEARHRLVGTTTLGANRGRVVEVGLPGAADAAVGPDQWRDLVPEGEAVIEAVAVTARSLLIATAWDGAAAVACHEPDGSGGRAVPLPGLCSLTGLAGSRHLDEAVVGLTSYTRPSMLFRWHRTIDGLSPLTDLPGPPLPPGSVELVEYPSTDGASVPLYLLRPATADAGGRGGPGPRPTVLTGYGGFGIAMGPAYSPLAVAVLERGGQVAVACIRGGGEKGESWHHAGRRDRKQQGFDDFAAAADWLVARGLTTRAQLAVRGGSNGGLLVAVTTTQRPDLCRAVVCAVPLTDMVRYPRFLIARLWVPEYGDPDVAEEFAWLYAYSPYHHVVDGVCYPATLVLTGEEDSRVDPAHARKFAARLQAATACGDDRPVLVRIEARAGHGAGKPASRQADESADVLAFLVGQLHLG